MRIFRQNYKKLFTEASVFGYFIYFRKKYSLINGFDADMKAGLKDESYAKRVGLAEFIIGIIILVTSIILVIFA